MITFADKHLLNYCRSRWKETLWNDWFVKKWNVFLIHFDCFAVNDVREYEKQMQQETNERLLNEMEGADSAKDGSSASSSKASTPTSAGPKKGWFNWSWWNCFLQKSRFFIHIQMYACRCAIEVANPIITHFISNFLCWSK